MAFGFAADWMVQRKLDNLEKVEVSADHHMVDLNIVTASCCKRVWLIFDRPWDEFTDLRRGLFLGPMTFKPKHSLYYIAMQPELHS